MVVIRHNGPFRAELELAIQPVLSGGWCTLGPEVDDFEAEFAVSWLPPCVVASVNGQLFTQRLLGLQRNGLADQGVARGKERLVRELGSPLDSRARQFEVPWRRNA